MNLPLQSPWPRTRAVPRVPITLSWHRSCRLVSLWASWWPSCASESAPLPHWNCARTNTSSNRNSYIQMRNSHVRAICKLRTKSHCHWVTPRRCTTRRIPMLCPTMRVSSRSPVPGSLPILLASAPKINGVCPGFCSQFMDAGLRLPLMQMHLTGRSAHAGKTNRTWRTPFLKSWLHFCASAEIFKWQLIAVRSSPVSLFARVSAVEVLKDPFKRPKWG